jgi:hypothetical protein
VGSSLGSGAGPTREAALAAAARKEEGALDRRKDLAAAAIAAARRARVVRCAGRHGGSGGPKWRNERHR